MGVRDMNVGIEILAFEFVDLEEDIKKRRHLGRIYYNIRIKRGSKVLEKKR